MLEKTRKFLYSTVFFTFLTLGSGTVLRAHEPGGFAEASHLEPLSPARDQKSFGKELLPTLNRHQQTLLDVPVKLDKEQQNEWRCSNRAGLRKVVTTLYNIHTREALPIFKARIPPAPVFDEFFRCRGFGFRKKLKPKLIETLLKAAEHFDASRVEIISAYRSEKFNDALAKKGRGVADESRHTRGEAIDFTLPEIPATALGAWLRAHFNGGVGTYPRDNFVHIDVGPKRSWTGS